MYTPAIDDPGAANFDADDVGVADRLEQNWERPESKSQVIALIADRERAEHEAAKGENAADRQVDHDGCRLAAGYSGTDERCQGDGVENKVPAAVLGVVVGHARDYNRRQLTLLLSPNAQHQAVLEDAELVIPRLAKLGGRTLGTSVGPAPKRKTPEQLDAQVELLRKVIALCRANGVVLNLHNHTYEVQDNLHDLKGTLARIPDVKLGPDSELAGAGPCRSSRVQSPVWQADRVPPPS